MPDDSGYAEACRIWNGEHNHHDPALACDNLAAADLVTADGRPSTRARTRIATSSRACAAASRSALAVGQPRLLQGDQPRPARRRPDRTALRAASRGARTAGELHTHQM